MVEGSTEKIVVKQSFDCDAEDVFDAWIDPEIARKWLFVTPNGEITRAEIDPHVGGKFIITRRDGEDIDHVVEYLTIDRPRLLAFKFSVPKFSEATTTVTIVISPRGNQCELVLTHEGVLPEWIDLTRSGWASLLAGLAQLKAV